ncbi:unnamed protein product [Ixodes persulcatus]
MHMVKFHLQALGPLGNFHAQILRTVTFQARAQNAVNTRSMHRNTTTTTEIAQYGGDVNKPGPTSGFRCSALRWRQMERLRHAYWPNSPPI